MTDPRTLLTVDRTTLSFPGDPRSTVGITWYTAESEQRVPIVHAEGSPAPSGTITVERAEVSTFVTADDRSNRKREVFFSNQAVVSDLVPDTRYEFTLAGGIHGSFRTAPEGPEDFEFLFGADSQASAPEVFEEAADTLRTALRTVPDARFVLINGDLIDNGDLEEQWRWLLNSSSDTLRRLPCVPVLGGHEVEDSGTTPNENFDHHFALPQEPGTGAHAGSVYAFEYGDALFVQLNSQFSGQLDDDGAVSAVDPVLAAQVRWMRSVITASDRRWTIVSFHKAIYSAGDNAAKWEPEYAAFVRAYLAPVLEELRVDVVLQAHDHMYMRSFPIRGGMVVSTPLDEDGRPIPQRTMNEPDGPVYLMPNALGPKYYDAAEGYDDWFAAVHEQPRQKMFVRIAVTENELKVTPYLLPELDSTGDRRPQELDPFVIRRR